MSEEAKNLLLRLKKEKKINKQIELVKALKSYNKEEIVNEVLLVHLDRKDHDYLRIEILNAINYENEQVIKKLFSLFKDPKETNTVKELVIKLLGKNKGKKALSILLTCYKKTKDLALLDNIIESLTLFDDKTVIKPLLKALKHKDLRLHVLTGLARNQSLSLSFLQLIKEIASLDVVNNLEKIHHEKILDNIFSEYNYKTKEELLNAIQNKSINKQIEVYQKKLSEKNKSLKKAH